MDLTPIDLRAYFLTLVDENHPHLRHVPACLNLQGSVGEVHNTPEKFAVSMNVTHFKPGEVKVNLNGNELKIEGSHDDKSDPHGTIKRSFVRKLIIPEDTNLDCISSSLSAQVHLKIHAQKKIQDCTQPKLIPLSRI